MLKHGHVPLKLLLPVGHVEATGLELGQVETSGFHMPDWEEELKGYMSML